MAQAGYNHILSEINNLSLTDQLRILENIVIMIRRKTKNKHSRSILELKGKGKDLWEDIDVKSYIDKERTSWNG